MVRPIGMNNDVNNDGNDNGNNDDDNRNDYDDNDDNADDGYGDKYLLELDGLLKNLKDNKKSLKTFSANIDDKS